MDTPEFRDYLLRYQSGDEFVRIFDNSSHPSEPGGPFVHRQRGHWLAMVQHALRKTGNTAEIELLNQIVQLFRTSDDWMHIRTDEMNVTIRSPLPLLDALDEDKLSAISADDLAAAVIYWAARGLGFAPATLPMATPALVSSMIDLAPRPGSEVDQKKQIQLDKANKAFRELAITLTEDRKSFDTEKAAWRAEHAELSANYKAAIDQARALTMFRSAQSLWGIKALRHTQAYIGGFIAIVVGVAAVPLFLWVFDFDIREKLPKNTNTGEYTYLAITLVALSFLAMAWAFRMMGRFVMDNLALASDARQREVALNTFLALVGTPAAQIKDNERILMLSAVFRSTPGSGTEDPAPGSLLEILKEALKPKGEASKT